MEGDGSDRTGAVLVGLPDFMVLAAAEVAGEVELLVETTVVEVGCPGCGVIAEGNGRRPVTVRDLPVAGRRTVLIWLKRLWRCRESACAVRSWSETSAQIRPRSALTERARLAAMRRVQAEETVAAVARDLQVGWHTVMRAVVDYGVPLVEDPDRLASVAAVGVDEHVWVHASANRRTGYATGIVDITPRRPARLLDVVPGRTGKVYADWIAEREAAWREHIRVAALDPFRGYATALATALPGATRVLDAFHVVALANKMVDEVRQRIQQETLGRRGHKGDPLYEIRRLLRRGIETLSDRARRKIDIALQVGDPTYAITVAWAAAQQLRSIYHAPNPQVGRARALTALTSLPDCPVPEVARLGRTLRAWRTELLAYFDTGGASNGPTEAMNLLIEKRRRAAHGFRNFRNYRLRLLLAHGLPCQDQPTAQIRTRRPRFVA